MSYIYDIYSEAHTVDRDREYLRIKRKGPEGPILLRYEFGIDLDVCVINIRLVQITLAIISVISGEYHSSAPPTTVVRSIL